MKQKTIKYTYPGTGRTYELTQLNDERGESPLIEIKRAGEYVARIGLSSLAQYVQDRIERD